MKEPLTKLERSWILYDIGNSAFVLLVATILPVYFKHLAGSAGISSSDYMAYWGYAASISTIIVALLGPVLGTVSDHADHKKPLFFCSVLLGSLACLLLGSARHWLIFIVIYIIAKIGYSVSLIFYDSMLPDITTPDCMDSVSSKGFAWGYIGSCIPFLLSLGLMLGYERLHIPLSWAAVLTFLITALWWLLLTIPVLKDYKQKHFLNEGRLSAWGSVRQLWDTVKEISKNRQIFLFLLAFFFYIDGVYTIIDMATAYGEALGLDTAGLLLALLLTQVIAFPCALVFGRLARHVATEKLITLSIVAYLIIALFAIQLDRQWEFWCLAICVGIFQGAIQALSRSYFAKIIPAEKSGEYFGILDIFGKGASFVGTGLVALLTQMTGNIGTGVSIISVLILIGLILFRLAIRSNMKIQKENHES